MTAQSLREELAARWPRAAESLIPESGLDQILCLAPLLVPEPVLCVLQRALLLETRRFGFAMYRDQLAAVEQSMREKRCPEAPLPGPVPRAWAPAEDPDWLRDLPRPWYLPRRDSSDLPPPFQSAP